MMAVWLTKRLAVHIERHPRGWWGTSRYYKSSWGLVLYNVFVLGRRIIIARPPVPGRFYPATVRFWFHPRGHLPQPGPYDPNTRD